MKRLNNGFNRGMDRLLDCVARFTFLFIAVVLSSVLNAVFVVLDADLNVFFFFCFFFLPCQWNGCLSIEVVGRRWLGPGPSRTIS